MKSGGDIGVNIGTTAGPGFVTGPTGTDAVGSLGADFTILFAKRFGVGLGIASVSNSSFGLADKPWTLVPVSLHIDVPWWYNDFLGGKFRAFVSWSPAFVRAYGRDEAGALLLNQSGDPIQTSIRRDGFFGGVAIDTKDWPAEWLGIGGSLMCAAGTNPAIGDWALLCQLLVRTDFCFGGPCKKE